MSVEFVPPHVRSALRVIFLGVMTDAFYEADERERAETVLPHFKQLVEDWRTLGARVLATLDDDLLMVGQPADGWTFYLMLEVDELETVVAMVNRIREPVDGVAMDRYVRFEARIGRPFFLLEEEN